MTYDISGSGFDDATSEMQLQLGGERERGDDAFRGVYDAYICIGLSE